MIKIEKYELYKNGYHPFLIRDGWQVAQLNYMDEQSIGNIHRLEVHKHTDEVFILLEGKAVLFNADITEKNTKFSVVPMQSMITYNVPQGCWHNIAMERGSKVIIVEKSNTHLTDVEYYSLTEENKNIMKQKVKKAFSEYYI